MARGIASSLQTKLAARSVFAADLIELHLSTPLYFTSTNIDIDFDSDTAPDTGSNTYLAQGQFLFFSNITESSDLRVGQIDMTFTAVDTTTVALLINNEFMNKRVVIYRAVLDNEYNFTSDDVFTIFDGNIMGYSINEESDNATVTITVASQFADFERTSGRRTNPASQQIHFPTDKGMDFSAQIVKDLKWGRA
tara:strand:- start:2815 stop:3396 length:582 start_codon:yes stop_codon:yes gene_type:complete